MASSENEAPASRGRVRLVTYLPNQWLVLAVDFRRDEHRDERSDLEAFGLEVAWACELGEEKACSVAGFADSLELSLKSLRAGRPQPPRLRSTQDWTLEENAVRILTCSRGATPEGRDVHWQDRITFRVPITRLADVLAEAAALVRALVAKEGAAAAASAVFALAGSGSGCAVGVQVWNANPKPWPPRWSLYIKGGAPGGATWVFDVIRPDALPLRDWRALCVDRSRELLLLTDERGETYGTVEATEDRIELFTKHLTVLIPRAEIVPQLSRALDHAAESQLFASPA